VVLQMVDYLAVVAVVLFQMEVLVVEEQFE
jgi:hypothetical protein